MTRARRAVADGLGTALLVAAVVGSGIMGERLSGGNEAIALLANSLATAFGLAALIIAFGPRCGAHFNPVVTIALALRGDCEKADVVPYILAQFTGALVGVAAAHLMFDLTIIQHSVKARSTFGLWWSECLASFGLVFVVLSCDRERPWSTPLAIAGYIGAAYWFTASTSFANPAVTLARGFTNTFAGIDLRHVLPFIVAQVIGSALACVTDHAFHSEHA